MGTNFYWLTKLPNEELDDLRMDPVAHIGKRSAAGKFCWDCNMTLCVRGNDGVHVCESRDDWHVACPNCGKQPAGEKPLESGPVALELGFATARETRPTGVAGTSSFTWAQDPDEVRRVCTEKGDEEIVRNEYGDRFTGRQFLDMLYANCGIEYHAIGRWFS